MHAYKIWQNMFLREADGSGGKKAAENGSAVAQSRHGSLLSWGVKQLSLPWKPVRLENALERHVSLHPSIHALTEAFVASLKNPHFQYLCSAARWRGREMSCSTSSKINEAWSFPNFTYVLTFDSTSPLPYPLHPQKPVYFPRVSPASSCVVLLSGWAAAAFSLFRAEPGCVLADHCPPG